jgi:hypothetical protein
MNYEYSKAAGEEGGKKNEARLGGRRAAGVGG